ncbi:hypothetical protein [Thalassobacillus sp. CUG 92003]|uniref:hypothetical protein n=1 Tax=Thalassobacillus sp. CUG 92003 TaxID=2736641 RepID=UPI0015E6F830|nr:hypothetical protein [Thalassobacillus sp. CUG 92003]
MFNRIKEVYQDRLLPFVFIQLVIIIGLVTAIIINVTSEETYFSWVLGLVGLSLLVSALEKYLQRKEKTKYGLDLILGFILVYGAFLW